MFLKPVCTSVKCVERCFFAAPEKSLTRIWEKEENEPLEKVLSSEVSLIPLRTNLRSVKASHTFSLLPNGNENLCSEHL